MTEVTAPAGDPENARHFDHAALQRMTDPANYYGIAPTMVDGLLEGSRR